MKPSMSGKGNSYLRQRPYEKLPWHAEDPMRQSRIQVQEEDKMRHVSRIGIMAFVMAVAATALVAGCTSAPLHTEASTSGSAPPRRPGRPKCRKPRFICN